MRISLILAILAAMAAGPTNGDDSTGRGRRVGSQSAAVGLVGSWTLLSFESRTAAGAVGYPLGRGARGQIIYEAAGYMSAHLMNPDRPKFASGDLAQGSDDEVRAAVAGYIAYYGTYTVDLQRAIVTHHVQGSLFPNWVGVDQVRQFRLDGDRLTITTPPIRLGGPEATMVLVWQRAR